MKLKLNDVMQKTLNQMKDILRKTEEVLKRRVHASGGKTSTDATV